jgi:competence ComEA-like helix-hairpin-helix protein
MLNLDRGERIIIAVLTITLVAGAALYCRSASRLRSKINVVRSGGGPVAAAININDAMAEELARIPGITRKLAASIVEYRDTHGYFHGVEDIKKVKGIGDSIFNRIRGRITTEGA